MTYRHTPVDVAGLTIPVTAIAAGHAHACALMAAGGVKCWGTNWSGQLGGGSTHGSLIPVDVNLAAHQVATLWASSPPKTVARGKTVVFTVTVRPLAPSGTRAIVRFVVHQRVTNGTWVLVAQRNVQADADGRARFSWMFALAGRWSVGAEALANESFAASTGTQPFRCDVP